MSNRQEKPFTSLGNHLKYVREQAKQSLGEVSGAVEIDENYLERIEAGVERPAEDILLLLIRHFGVKDREAVQLWESAEYDSDMPEDIRISEEQIVLNNKSVMMVMAVDMRTIYTDDITVMANPSGVTLQFNQTQGQGQTSPVARLGMSQDQAEIVVKALQTALLHAKYGGATKLLPPPNAPEA
jgi:transcriptional regulator with XRE-family HTH domain